MLGMELDPSFLLILTMPFGYIFEILKSGPDQSMHVQGKDRPVFGISIWSMDALLVRCFDLRDVYKYPFIHRHSEFGSLSFIQRHL